MNRFDYVKYDDLATQAQALYKTKFQDLENAVEECFKQQGRAKALILTKLEEAYMWVGKAIRDEQIFRIGSAPLQEGRGNE